MVEGKGLLHPNVKSIQELLDLRTWDASALAAHSELDLRTVESILRGERKQWAVMEIVATTLGVPLSQIVNDLSKDQAEWPAYSSVRIFKDWEPAWPAIESARESVLIVDSFFMNEHGRLGTALEKNKSSRKVPLRVSIYMASPNRSFGAQRLREMNLPPKELLAGKSTLRDEKYYGTLFGSLVASIKKLRDRKTEISLFEYFCMPSVRILLVDRVHFFWGWYPLAAQNPTHICLYLQSRGGNAADNELCERLSEHIAKIAERSAPV